jgi:hypothetical protein
MAGLFDWLSTPAGQGLLAAGLGAAANANRSPAIALGRGGLMGLAGYTAAQQGQLREQEEAQQRQLRGLQIGQLQRQITDADTERDVLRNFYQGNGLPKTGSTGAGLSPENSAALPPEMQTGVSVGQMPGFTPPPKTDMYSRYQSLAQEFASRGLSAQAKAALETAEKFRPKFSTTPQVMMVGGKPTNVLVGEDGSVKTLDGFGVKPDIQLQDLGGAVQAIDKNNTQGGQTFHKTGNPFSDLMLRAPDGSMVPNAPLVDTKKQIARAGASNVSVTTRQETEESKAVGKFFGENYADVQKAGFTAQSAINRLNRLGGLLEGVDTGKFTPLGVEVAKTAEALGVKIDPKLANKEAAVALSSEIALQLRNPSGGAGMPGAMSDADRNFLAGMVPGIEKTPEGRKMILETAKKLAQRDIEVARMAREYRQKNGTINEGFYEKLAQFSEANPLFKSQQSAAPSAAPADWVWKDGKLVKGR